MAAVGRQNTGPELALRRALFACGLRFRLARRRPLPGTPDIVFPSARVAVFVDGCFWHACPLHGTTPKTRRSFWFAKLTRNAQRDATVNASLAQLGWKSVRVWEHEIKQDVEDAALRL